MKRIISLTINNFQNDNRVYRIAKAFQDWGNEVTIVGIVKGEVPEREVFKGVPVHRVKLKSGSNPRNNKLIGLVQYIELFFQVIFTYRKLDIWHCNDFEAFLIGSLAKITRPRLTLVYDCHEYERERQGMPKLVKLFVKTFEGVLIPLASQVITVGPSIKKEYERLYGLKNVHLVRNTPHLMPVVKHNKFREVFPIRDDQKIFLYQGMLTPGRGIEIMLETFKLREKQDAVLVIMGHGKMKDLVEQSVAGQDKLFYHPSVPYELIHTYTSSADVGLNTVQNTSLSYYYCLPNKLFEYIQCGLPILTNALPDCMALVQQEHIGHVIQTYTAAGFNQAIDEMLEQDWREYHQNLARIKPMYQWDVEIEALKNVYSPIL